MIEERIENNREDEAVRIIQNAYRENRDRKRKEERVENIGMIKERDIVQEGVRKISDVKEYEDSKELSLRNVPLSSLIIVIEYLGKCETFFSFAVVCKHVQKAYRYNVVWNRYFELNYPKMVQFVLEKNNNPELSNVNLKTLLKGASDEIITLTSQMIETLKSQKDEGNKLYQEEKYEDAISVYDKVAETSSMYKTKFQNEIFDQVCPKAKKVELLHLICIMNSNSSQASINIERWSSAYNSAKRGFKYINLINKLIPKIEEFEERFGLLKKKVEMRLLASRENILPLFRFLRYSEVPVDELRVGTLLSATDNISGDIFCDSKVLIYEFERGHVEYNY